MGGCPSHCEVRCGNGMRYEGSVMELNLEQQHFERDKEQDRKRSASSSRHAESMTLPNTKFKKENEYGILHTQSDPKNELISSNIEMEFLPVFVTNKQINESSVQQRQNRFIQDLEIEVKSKIQEIYKQEQEEKQICMIKQLVQQQLEQERQRNQSQIIQENNSQENYKHYSTQVSPNKNASNNSKDSQYASLQSSSRQLSSDKQSNNQLTNNKTDPQKYHIDENIKNQALEKLASNFYLEEGSCSSRQKGILKQQFKYAHTSKSLPNRKNFFQTKKKKMKRVHFSHDTNFNFEKKSEGSKTHKSWWKSLF